MIFSRSGFTLLEVMVAVAIMAIALVAVFGSQSQSLFFATEAKFATTSVFLAQGKMAEAETEEPADLGSGSGDFGDDFPGYRWERQVSDPYISEPEGVSDHLKQVDLTVYIGDRDQAQYGLRLYRFVPETRQ